MHWLAPDHSRYSVGGGGGGERGGGGGGEGTLVVYVPVFDHKI